MRFSHILFATDFSEDSAALTCELEWLANRFQSKVTLIHVLEFPAFWGAGVDFGYSVLDSLDELNGEASKRLRELAIDVPAERVQRVLAHGDVAAEIADYAGRHEVDLIIMGTHGRGPVRSLLCGSVLAKLLHEVNIPVWTAAFNDGLCRYRPVISKILCALELTQEALPLLHTVAGLAEAFSAQVRVVHAVPGPETRPNKYFDVDLHQYLVESARDEIAKMQREAGTGFPVTIASASIVKGIADAARDYGCDLVVIGRGKAQLPLGRVRTHACEIVRHVLCPVLSCVVAQDSSVFANEQLHLEEVENHTPAVA